MAIFFRKFQDLIDNYIINPQLIEFGFPSGILKDLPRKLELQARASLHASRVSLVCDNYRGKPRYGEEFLQDARSYCLGSAWILP